MSERSPNQLEQLDQRPLGQAVTELTFDIKTKMNKDGDKTYWLDSFNNMYTNISGKIGMIQLGLSEELLPEGREDEIYKLNDQIIRESKIKRDRDETEKALLPLLEQLTALFG